VSYLTIKKLLELQLNTVASPLDTAWENAPFVPKQGTPWQRVTLLPATTENPTLGDQFKMERGVLKVSLFYPEKSGAQAAMIRAEAIRLIFARGLSLIDGTVRVKIETHPYINPGFAEDGWYLLPVSVPFIAEVY
jgi:hypothetical protein